jgi:hypothetical protein
VALYIQPVKVYKVFLAFYSKSKCWALRASSILRAGFFLGRNRVGKYRGPRGHTLVTCFITFCESFLGIEPHFLLWKFLFRLCPSVALSKKPELGGAVISIRAESQYLEFSMAASVQGWRKKRFYIKDRKVSSSDQYGIAPFDASKEVKKLTSWDSPPTEAEMEEIKPLLACIQELKSSRGGALSGTQLMVFFLQHRVQPL